MRKDKESVDDYDEVFDRCVVVDWDIGGILLVH
jgi:hypothetical protein